MVAIIFFALIGEIFSCLLSYSYGWPIMLLAYIVGGTVFPVIGVLLCYGRHTGYNHTACSADRFPPSPSATNPTTPEVGLMASDAMLRGSHNLHSGYFDQTGSS
jgi:hypothetical protein